MTSLEYEPQLQEASVPPWHFRTPADAACFAILSHHLIWISLILLRRIALHEPLPFLWYSQSDQILLAAELGLLALAFCRFVGRHLLNEKIWAAILLVILAVRGGAQADLVLHRSIPRAADGLIAFVFAFGLGITLFSDLMIAIAASGGWTNDAKRILWRKRLLYPMMTLYLLLVTLQQGLRYYLDRFHMISHPASMFVRPVICMLILLAAVWQLGATLMRARNNESAVVSWPTWMSAVILILGMFLLQNFADDETDWIWTLGNLLGDVALVATALIFARRWPMRGVKNEQPIG